MSQENVEIARRLFASWEKGDFMTMSEVYAPDVEMHWSSGVRVVRGGSETFKGLSEISTATREWVKEWDWWSVSADEFIDVDDHVVVPSTIHARLKGAKGEVHHHEAQVLTFREGTIVRIEGFDTRREALKAVGLEE